MSSRTSTRQAVASSPPRNQQAAARTRNMRSRSVSVDLGATAQVGRRTTRQGSVGSVASNASTSRGNGKGKGKGNAKGQGVKASAPDLSVLNEDSEDESEPGSEEMEELNFDFDDLNSLRDDSSQLGGSKESQLRAEEQKSNTRKLNETLKAASKSTPVEKETSSSSRPAQPGPSRVPAKASSSRNNEGDAEVPGSTNEEILDFWTQSTRDNNKENTKPAQKVQKAQPRAQEERGGPSKKRPFIQDEEDEDEDDEAFQTDTRPTDPARVVRPAVRSPKRPRVEDSESSGDQPRHRREREREPSESEEELEAPPSPPISAKVKAVAKVNVANATIPTRQTQGRQKWSDNDEAELIRLVGEHGCAWSRLVELGDWEIVRPNFQVQLKDKARNIKVSYLKSGTPLPDNFERVRLGRKEIEAVQRVFPDYEQD